MVRSYFFVSSRMNRVSLTIIMNTCFSRFSSFLSEKSGYFSTIFERMNLSSILRICFSFV